MISLYKINIIPFATIVTALLFCIPLMGFNQQTAKPQAAAAAAAQAAPAANAVQEDATDAALKAAGLTSLRSLNTDFVFEIRYASTNNFTGAPLYKSDKCYLRTDTASKLADANRDFISRGYKIKIFDAYRPYSVQLTLYAKTPDSLKSMLFIADPYNGGSNHNRGAAVDITLVHLDGTPVSMPTDFDSFTKSARINSEDIDRTLPKDVLANRELLASVMLQHGFKRINNEWWHFDDCNAGSYTILDIPF